jgi:uncharacterized protein YndB with AHSA1/START domain
MTTDGARRSNTEPAAGGAGRLPSDGNGADAETLRFACIVTEVDLPCGVATAFDLVTNPTRWARWHPATAAVSGAEDRPLQPGESVTETIAAGGRRFDATWTVLASEPPRRWIIATAAAAGDARIVYELRPTAAGCRFVRTLCFRSHRAPWRWLDRNLTRWLLARQSRRALANLRRLIAGAAG